MERALLLCLTAWLTTGCRAPANGPPAASPQGASYRAVTLQLDRATYRPGQAVRLTLTNERAAAYAYNPCTRVVQRRVGVEWHAAERDRICTMEAWILPAGGAASASTTLPDDLLGGQYRIVLVLTAEGAARETGTRVEAVSPTFEVAP